MTVSCKKGRLWRNCAHAFLAAPNSALPSRLSSSVQAAGVSPTASGTSPLATEAKPRRAVPAGGAAEHLGLGEGG